MQFSPYIIEPFLIPQPTWGGKYIAQKKGWSEQETLKDIKIGQSYELFGKSRVYPSITDTNDPSFLPLIKNIASKNSATPLTDLISKDPEGFLGSDIASRFTTIPILIKFTQARGNSFQLHASHLAKQTKWKPKSETWYFLEPGMCTYGLSDVSRVSQYKAVCMAINDYMHTLSDKVKNNTITLSEAQEQSQSFIREQNPWRFVNAIHTNPFDCIDLSNGGIHHSWEDSPDLLLGNIVYEVQEDVSDEESTLRSFDQGKFLPDGSIRELTIEDYFSLIDTNPEHNAVESTLSNIQNGKLVENDFYAVYSSTTTQKTILPQQNSFQHIFITNGIVSLESSVGSVLLHSGHSAVIPYSVGDFAVIPTHTSASYILTYCPKKKGDSV